MASLYSKNNRIRQSWRVYLLCLLSAFFITVSTKVMAEATDDTIAPQTRFFFGDKNKYEESSNAVLDDAFHGVEESSGHQEENHSSQDQWIDEDISPLFPELQIIDELSTKKSLERMNKARGHYTHAKHSIQISLRESDLESKKFSLEGVRYDWEKIDRNEELNRKLRRIETKGRMEAINYLIMGIREMDKIQNPVILKSEAYISLKANFYREYIKQQFKNRNLHLCVDILQRYLELKPSHKQEPEAHRLLAACYRYQEIMAERARDNNGAWDFKVKKNKHLADYALLAFGKDSAQFRYIKNKIDNDLVLVPLN